MSSSICLKIGSINLNAIGRPAGQLDGSDNMSAMVAAVRASPAAVAELGRYPTEILDMLNRVSLAFSVAFVTSVLSGSLSHAHDLPRFGTLPELDIRKPAR